MVELPSYLERLVSVAGVRDWGEAQRQAARLSEIPALLGESVEQAWEKCLPEWVDFGRVRDLSPCIRVPIYNPSFANRLGAAFVERFRNDPEFLIGRLELYPVESTEYLCVCDLIEFLMHEHAYDRPEVRQLLFALHRALPPVIQFECDECYKFSVRVESVGQFLRQIYARDYED
jgi:hypothetical protein